MTNPESRNFTGNIFYWQIRKATLKKTSSKLFHRAYRKLERPVWHQICVPITQTIRNAVKKQR